MRIIWTLILTIAVLPNLLGQLQINEICSKNESVLYDQGGNTPDFIELLNISDEEIDLDDYYLSDRADDIFQWELPDLELAPGQMIILFGRTEIQTPVHAPFRLDSGGESLFLVDEDGNLMDQVIVPPLQANNSFGRTLSGEWRYFERPTPDAQNLTIDYAGYASPPVFSVPSGFHKEGITLDEQQGSGHIYYSNDGSKPYPGGELWTSSIAIDTTQVIRAVRRQEGFLPSEIVTNTYVIGEDKYLPVVSLSCEPEDLWGQDSGIYVLGLEADTVWPYWGANFWDGRQVPVHVEYFEHEELVFEQQADMRVHGGKAARNMPQKPLRIIGRKDYGDKYFHHQLIKQKPLHQYKKFVLRNSGGDFNQLHFRDCWIHRLVLDSDMDVDVNGCEPAVVYLNGQYWGIQNIREKIDKYYCRFNGGYDEDVTYTILEEDTIILEGTREEFNQMLQFFQTRDLSEPQYFDSAATLLDIHSMTDYIIVETFWNNTDWPANNQKYWKPNIEGGKWRFVMFDMDVSLNGVGYVSETTNNLGRILDRFEHIELVALWINLLENPEYKRYFINRYADVMNTSFTASRLETELLEFLWEMEPEMEHSLERWGSATHWWWFFDINPRALVFVQERTKWAQAQVKSSFKLAGIYDLTLDAWPPAAGTFELNTLELDEATWTGKYYHDVAIDVAVEAKSGYQFSHWKDDLGNVYSESSIQANYHQDVRLTAVFEAEVNATLQLFPNPSNGQCSLNFLNDTYQQTRIQVADLSGRIVFSQDFGLLPPGVHQHEFVLNLASGSYVVGLIRGQEVESARMTIY